MKKHWTILFFLCCSLLKLSAQSSRSISGCVTDSNKTAIANVRVLAIAGQDTIRTATDQSGKFIISTIKARKFSLNISHPGYFSITDDYKFTAKNKHLLLDTFILWKSGTLLKEVVIKSKPTPMRFMLDTVEYNVAAFEVIEGDNLADLLKRFPGMEVDGDYNVQTAGKNITKLRVNGVDFFDGNVREFIGKLPAGIVSKIQVIDDFGDEANFTGIKTGEPKKIMNIVTEPGMNKGLFGSLSGDAGTNNMLGSNATINSWKAEKQSSANIHASKLNNGAGDSKIFSLGFSHNDKLGKNSKSGVNYDFRNNSSAFLYEQDIESQDARGNLFNSTGSNGTNGRNQHNLNWNTNFNNKKIFLNGSVMGAYSASDNQNLSFNNASGFLRQDLKISNVSESSAPNIAGNLSLSKKLKNAKNSFSLRASFSMNGSQNQQGIRTNTLYYDNNTGVLLKDSLLNREVSSKLNSQNFDFGFDYSLGLRKLKDSLARQSLNLSYNGGANYSMNEASTLVFDNNSDKVLYVDSLSTSFSSIIVNHSLGVHYNYNAGKMRYNIGLNARPVMQRNRDLKLMSIIESNTFNYSPSLNFSRRFATGKTLSLNYIGSNNNPSIYQLQPIRNAISLQNIVVGNPDLKPSFTHSLDTDFNYAHAKSGKSLQFGLSALVKEREIVNHQTIVQDTLNSFKQISKYENIDGNYAVNGSFRVHIPVKSQKFSLNYSGTVGFSNQGVIFNNQKSYGKGLNFSQQLGGNLTLKKISMNTNFSYFITNNNNTNSINSFYGSSATGIGQITAPTFFRTATLSAMLDMNMRFEKLSINSGIRYNSTHNQSTGTLYSRNIGVLNANLSSGLTIRKSYRVRFTLVKRSNFGYALTNTNPLIIHAGLEKSFLKNKSLNLSINGADLLRQGNNLSRTIAGNTIIDSRSTLQTRIISMRLNYNLSNFGGERFRVDPD